MQNKKLDIYRALLLPSGIGAVFYTFAAGMVIFLRQFSFIQQYLQIPDNVNFLRMFLDWLDRAVTSLLGQTNTETVVVGLFWALVGLVVYVFLRGVARFISDVSEGIEERSYLWPRGVDRNQAVRESVERVIFRILAFVGLAVVAFGPLMTSLNGPKHTHSASLYYAIWFALIWAGLHICVVLIRLTALKPRLFG